MARNVVVQERNVHRRTKVKTGCETCRIRRVKCDENKPFCHRCVNTGRTCDGYKSPFRFSTSQLIKNAHTSGNKSALSLQPIQPTLTEIATEEIDLLSRYFSIKTIFNVNLGCYEEARQVLQASLTDPSIRHAITSLRALRENFETSETDLRLVSQQTSSYDYGVQQYGMALRGLVSNLSSPSPSRLRSALLCCQIFISIEQVQQNYAAMAQHIIRGLKIMHEYRARPHLTITNKLMPAYHDQLPLLDVFLIKLFSAPCKFADPSARADVGGNVLPVCLTSPHQLPESRNLRTIAPDMRTKLTRIAALTLTFLDKVSQVESAQDALRSLSEKSSLLDSLELWLVDIEIFQTETGSSESISVSFLRLFHSIMKIILLGALDSSPDLHTELRTENDRLQSVADSLGEKLRIHRPFNRIKTEQQERSKVR